MDITITLTETEYKGLEYVANSPQEWVENSAINRARIANDEIIRITVDYCLDNGVALPSTREEMVAYAFDTGLVKTAAQRDAEAAQPE